MRILVVTRRDLSPEAQASQSCQALMQFNCAYPALGRTWYERQNLIDVYVVPGEDALRALLVKVKTKDLKAVGFHEPQLKMQLTTIAVEATPMARKVLGKLTIAR